MVVMVPKVGSPVRSYYSRRRALKEIRIRETKVRMVEGIERLGAYRDVEPFRNLEVLEQVEVKVEVVRPAILVAPLRRIAR